MTTRLEGIQDDIRQMRGQHEQEIQQLRMENRSLQETVNKCNNTVDRGISIMDQADQELDHVRRMKTPNPQLAVIASRRKKRDDELLGSEEVFSIQTGLEGDVTDMIQ